MAGIKDLGEHFVALSEEDKAAVVTTVMEVPNLHGNDLSHATKLSAVRRMSQSPEAMADARRFYAEWQQAGKQASHTVRVMKHNPHSKQDRSK